MMTFYGPFPAYLWFFIICFVCGLPALLFLNRFFNWIARIDSEPPFRHHK